MSLLSAWSISLDSTFKPKITIGRLKSQTLKCSDTIGRSNRYRKIESVSEDRIGIGRSNRYRNRPDPSRLTVPLNLFFHSATYNCKCAYLSFENSTPPQFTSEQWSLFRLWKLEWRNGDVLVTPLHYLQMCGAFIAVFTSEKRWMTI
jgi:hypothetical protein